MAIDQPNYTQVPNEILDHMNEFGEAELRVILAICRKTFGWHKKRDRISLSQMMESTGLSRQGACNGIKRAIKSDIVISTENGNSFDYEIKVELVNEVDQNRSTTLTKIGLLSRHTKEKRKKENSDTDSVSHSGGKKVNYESKLERDLGDKRTAKKRVYMPNTELARYLAENATYFNAHWKGFTKKKYHDNWIAVETADPEGLKKAIEWGLSRQMPIGSIGDNILIHYQKWIAKSGSDNQTGDTAVLKVNWG